MYMKLDFFIAVHMNRNQMQTHFFILTCLLVKYTYEFEHSPSHLQVSPASSQVQLVCGSDAIRVQFTREIHVCRLTCSWMALYKPLVSFPLQYLITMTSEGRGRVGELVMCSDVMWDQVDRR